MDVLRSRELHEEAVRLHEEDAEHARALGDEATVRRAEEPVERARERALLSKSEDRSTLLAQGISARS